MGARQQGQLVSSGSIVTSTIGPRPGGYRVLLVVGGLIRRNGLLDVLDREKQLLGIKLLRAPAELHTLQLAQQMPQAIDLRQCLVARGNRSVTLGARGRHQLRCPLEAEVRSRSRGVLNQIRVRL
jgi:hypothetical protein